MDCVEVCLSIASMSPCVQVEVGVVLHSPLFQSDGYSCVGVEGAWQTWEIPCGSLEVEGCLMQRWLQSLH